MKYDIITFGGAVIDAFLYTGLPEIHGKMCYSVGAKIEVQNMELSTGGAGTNTAVSFAKLGLKTGAIIKIGQDSNAQIILKELKQNKIDFLGSQAPGLTDFSAILDSKEHERTILTQKRQSNSISSRDISLSKLKTKWFYFSAMDSTALQTQIKLSQYARKNKIKIAYNPSSYLTSQGLQKIRLLISKATVLILNDEEARDLIPRGDLFEGLHKLGPEYVCITFGKKGNKVSYNGKILTALPRKIKVKERTGAGDAFASGFVTGLIKFNDIRKAIALGSLNAESVIQIPGAKNGLLYWNQAIKYLNKIKITEKVI